MRKTSAIFMMILIAAAVLSACGGRDTTESPTNPPEVEEEEPLHDTDSDSTTARIISVTGTGTAMLEPDTATVRIGVLTEDREAAKAVEDNDLKVEEVLTALGAFGISTDDIQTSTFDLIPLQDLNASGQVTRTNFQVKNTVEVTVRELERLGELLDAVVAAGANTIGEIDYGVEEETYQFAYVQTLEAAMKEARRQADTAAKAAGEKVGEVLSISVTTNGTGMDEAPGEPSSPGQTELSVTVFVSYAMEAKEEEAAPTEEPGE